MQHLSWSLSDKLSVDPFRIHEVYRRENIETLRGPDGVEHRFFIGEVKQEHLEKPFDYFHLTYVFSKIDDDRSHEIQTESIILRPLIRLGEGGSADIYIERDVKHTGWWLDPVLNQNSAEDALSFEVGV
jgi:hypothetical protein